MGYLQEEGDKVDACEEVLQAAEDGKVVIVTSALTIAEVLALKGRDKIPAERRSKVELFFRNEYIDVINITRRIAEAARSFVWDYGVLPKDALHVATAIDVRLTLLNTFDMPLVKKSGKIGQPPLVIAKPTWQEPKLPMQLPHDKKSKK